MPCMMHEKVSRMLATRLGSREKRLEMSFAMPDTVMMATVLFAVQRSVTLTRAAMLSSAERGELTCFMIRFIR